MDISNKSDSDWPMSWMYTAGCGHNAGCNGKWMAYITVSSFYRNVLEIGTAYAAQNLLIPSNQLHTMPLPLLAESMSKSQKM